MATSFPTIRLTSDWLDITTVVPALSGTKVLMQNRSDKSIFIYFGGSKPTPLDGVSIDAGNVAVGTANNIWVRGPGHLACMQPDS
jgi:hypothetical protein